MSVRQLRGLRPMTTLGGGLNQGNGPYDELPAKDARLADLDQELLADYRERVQATGDITSLLGATTCSPATARLQMPQFLDVSRTWSTPLCIARTAWPATTFEWRFTLTALSSKAPVGSPDWRT